MKVSDIMTKKVISVKEESPISEVAKLLFEKDLTGIPVINDSNHVVGIVTEYDLISESSDIHIPTYINLLTQLKLVKGNEKEIQKNIDEIKDIRVRDIMTYPVVTLSGDTEVSEAARIFTEDRINPLPVVNSSGVLIGIISRADIVKLFKIENN